MKDKPKHSKPWEFDPETLCVLDADGNKVCEVEFPIERSEPPEVSERRMLANADLIATAPEWPSAAIRFREMLVDEIEQDNKGVGHMEEMLWAFDRVFAPLLAKARGES